MSKIYDDPKYNATFDRCIDVMAKLMQKYGSQVLERQEQKTLVRLSESPEKKKKHIMDHAA